ncbi:error-prone DNA polymerase [Herbiconiux sp. CPCC 203407]|uniref:Error-prone DNA polymerase n=1 Tax=Herbiconiux oxytropis TaxID=2970915 RepID=A0AA42BWD8_9MICO|nr:error-prone DNA polymerase [Herbiconiux oxytropis]MCS5720390.1 error-prone DNA polymerase [Herbiconiux oxytropis]MCS5725963.1 error-prone DNA polymerase [Herbiconiux oxytropis]
MGFNNPPVPWSELENALSDRRRPGSPPADGGDSPAWSTKRLPYDPGLLPPVEREAGPLVPYAELHAHSNFSFLDGASSPEELIEEATRLRLHALALTDHDGLYGIVRFAEAAEKHELATVFGAELSLDLSGPQNGSPDPEGSHLLVLARRQEGYHRLAGAITSAQLAPGAEKGRPLYDLEELAGHADGHWAVLTGCRKGPVRQALDDTGEDGAAAEIDRLVALFGRENVLVELSDRGDPRDSTRNDALAAIAGRQGLATIATGNVHYAAPGRHRLAQALAAVRARRSLDELDGWLPASPHLHLRSGAEMATRFGRFTGAVERTVEVADDLSFRLRTAKPNLPRQEVPEGHTPMSWLRRLVQGAIPEKYPRASEDDLARIDKELGVIELKDFPGYFLIVYDIVREARSRGILCQGRGSAANSAVCYLLGITAVDAIARQLPFERFLSSMRDEEPDIDVDFDSDRREEIIQYVYEKYGRRNAAQVANVITYRPKFAVRDMAKALGHSPGQQDAWSKQVERWGGVVESADHDIPAEVVELAEQVLKFPRHLGIHSGGMVLTDRPVGEVCPIENARMEKRTVLQWDKDDCAWMGLVKFDLLGLGMLSALQYTIDLVKESTGTEWSLENIPKEEEGVYDMLCRADSIGVFQVESRAQMGTLPRLQPRRFYDLVVEIALIRPGPIQGGAVHPYIRRKLGLEEVTYLHPKLKPVLERTLGVPLFQEQLMQMAMAVGDCSAEDADLLRRAMGSKRGLEKISSLREKLYSGMAGNGIVGDDADLIYRKIEAFANFGFAESHSTSFALLVYASSWFKLHYPAAFLAALLRAQPMGFYSPQTLTADARRHGVEVRRPDIQRSGVQAGLEPLLLAHGAPDASVEPGARGATGTSGTLGATGSPLDETGLDGCVLEPPPVPNVFDRSKPDRSAEHRRDGRLAVRLGLAEVTSIGETLATRIVTEREERGPYLSMADLSRRVGLTTPQLEALATAGAFEPLGLTKREALWEAGNASQERPEYLPGTFVSVQPPLLPMLSAEEQVVYDLWATGISPEGHPLQHVRAQLRQRGALSVADLATAEPGRRIEVGGVVTHRQRPATASGITFMNIEDETGLLNVICGVGVWTRYRRVARESPALIVRGLLERTKEGITNLVADRFEPLTLSAKTNSRDFR